MKVTFPRNSSGTDFASELKKRVRTYLKDNDIKPHANGAMYFKTGLMLLVYFIPLSLIIAGVIPSTLALFAAFILCGVGMAGIGFGIMHDAIHGAYSDNKWVNRVMGWTVNLIGGNDEIWHMQHNVLHHTYTNIEDHDEDINSPIFLRFSPNSEYIGMNKYQHIYAWFFYSLASISWVTAKDFIRAKRFYDRGLVKSKKEYHNLVTRILGWKVLYYMLVLGLPMVFSGFPVGTVLGAFIVMHLVTGLIITIVFQSAHIVPEVQHPLPNEAGTMENERFIHQMITTCNFAQDNKFLRWYAGGLTNQVEHHLFPNICHVHYPAISKIVKETAEEYGVPYNSYPTMREAIYKHYLMLKQLGQEQSKKPAASVAAA